MPGASWANPIEARLGPLRMFTMENGSYPNHAVLAREMQKYLRWRDAHARHPDVLTAQSRERAASAANANTAGVAPVAKPPDDQTRQTFMDNAPV